MSVATDQQASAAGSGPAAAAAARGGGGGGEGGEGGGDGVQRKAEPSPRGEEKEWFILRNSLRTCQDQQCEKTIEFLQKVCQKSWASDCRQRKNTRKEIISNDDLLQELRYLLGDQAVKMSYRRIGQH